MTVLAELSRGLVSIQCDLDVPPVLTINTRSDLRRTGWTLRADGHPWDICPTCAMRVPVRQRVARGDPAPVAPDPGLLPNLVVIGASKAGTTSMHNYLAAHPEVTGSKDKEARFFQDPGCRNWIGAYQDNFVAGTRYRVESTPFYTFAPCYPGVVDRMADLVPDARLIYMVRDPVDRLVAEYAEQMMWGAATRSLDEELVDAADPRNWLMAASRYATQLEDYLRRFDRARITVVDLADLASSPDAVLASVFGALDLDPGLVDAAALPRLNTRGDKRAYPAWFNTLRGGPIARAAHRIPEGPRLAVTRIAQRHLRKPVETPTLSETSANILRELLAPEVQRLRAMTGQAFASWSV